jgi:hypothetical protein
MTITISTYRCAGCDKLLYEDSRNQERPVHIVDGHIYCLSCFAVLRDALRLHQIVGTA